MNESVSVEHSIEDHSASPGSYPDPTLCPVSGTMGSKVDRITLKALLRGDALRRLDGHAYRFCPERECEVVYFDWVAGSIFRKGDLEVRVGQKESADPIPICYCFNVTLEDLRQDLAPAGAKALRAMVAAEVKAGHCACEVKNPQGTCCLGNLARASRRI